ncbi:MAG: metal-dependent hydrolase [candidate division WOR-3 bacterium]
MRRSTHVAVGAFAACGAELIRCFVNKEQVDWLKVAAAGLVGGCVAVAPDLLEPALHPNHRGLFHGLATGGAAVYGAVKNTKATAPDTWLRLLGRSAAIGYLSHLVLDATTPKGLPIVG